MKNSRKHGTEEGGYRAALLVALASDLQVRSSLIVLPLKGIQRYFNCTVAQKCDTVTIVIKYKVM